jgi:hypothetical protein
MEHEIETGDATPINTRAYPLLSQQLEEKAKQIAELMEKGLIRESTSSWGSPVLFVKKANGGWRMCRLSRIEPQDAPQGQTLVNVGSDVGILANPRSTQRHFKAAFNTRYGKCKFLVMPFGLTNAPATFQKRLSTIGMDSTSFRYAILHERGSTATSQTLTNRVLCSFIDKYVVVYTSQKTRDWARPCHPVGGGS